MKRIIVKFIGKDAPNPWNPAGDPVRHRMLPARKSPDEDNPREARRRSDNPVADDPFATPLDPGDVGSNHELENPTTAYRIREIPALGPPHDKKHRFDRNNQWKQALAPG